MKSFLKTLRPTPLMTVIFVLLLGLQAGLLTTGTGSMVICTDGSQPEPAVWHTNFGLGGPVVIVSEGNASHVEVHLAVLVVNLAACYTLAALLASVTAALTKLRRPALACLAAILVVVLATFVAAIVISRNMWGYWFSRPAILREADSIARVEAVISFDVKTLDTGERRLVADDNRTIREAFYWAEQDPYSILDTRILYRLRDRKLLPPDVTRDVGNLAGLYPKIAASGLLAKSDEGYRSDDWMGGFIVDARDASGRRLVFIGACAGEVSNDHHPYYEMVFRDLGDGRGLTYVRGQRFFYDVAGIEGFEWYAIWIMLTAFALPVLLPLAALVVFLRHRLRKLMIERLTVTG